MKYAITFVLLHLCFISFAQNKKQKDLEARKKELLLQIKELSAQRNKHTQERKSVATQIQEINKKIQTRTEIIRITNQQALLLDKEIKHNTAQISELEKELTALRKEYASIIFESYKNKIGQRQLLFLLSSETFTQGVKRMKYMRQYALYRKKQGIAIEKKNRRLTKITQNLQNKFQEKEQILQETQNAQNLLSSEKKQQEALVVQLQKKENEYEFEIRKRQAEANKIDREIDRLIRLTIAETNRKNALAKQNSAKTIASASKTKSKSKAKIAIQPTPTAVHSQEVAQTNTSVSETTEKTSTTIFELTPEGQTISVNFEANKGRFIWPVERGYKSQGFGPYSDPLYPEVKHNSSGVVITSPQNTDARAIFNGEVSAIMAVPGGNKGVQIRHGNFISIYYNLSQVYVSKGQKVNEKTPLGRIATNSDGKTEMKFFLYRNTTKLNPELWIHRM